MGAIDQTVNEVIPLFKEGMEARLGGKITILRVIPFVVNVIRDNFDEDIIGPDEAGCYTAVISWTEVTVFKIKFYILLEINGKVIPDTYTLGPYVVTEKIKKEIKHCTGEPGHGYKIETDGPKKYGLTKQEQKEFMVKFNPKLKYKKRKSKA